MPKISDKTQVPADADPENTVADEAVPANDEVVQDEVVQDEVVQGEHQQRRIVEQPMDPRGATSPQTPRDMLRQAAKPESEIPFCPPVPDGVVDPDAGISYQTVGRVSTTTDAIKGGETLPENG